MELTHPFFLWLLLLLPVAAWVAFRASRADLNAAQRVASFFIRACLLACIVLALAGARFLKSTDALAVLFVVDDSLSVSEQGRAEARDFVNAALSQARSQDIAGIIGFARQPRIWLPPRPAQGAKFAGFPPSTEKERLATDIGRALEFAAAVFPESATRRILLVTDGNDTGDRGAEVAARLAEQGVQVDVFAVRNPSVPEVLIERLEIPPGLRPGEPFTLGVRVRSNTDTTVTLRLYANRFLVGSQETRLRPGMSRVDFPKLEAQRALTTYDAEIIPARDTVAGNNRGTTTAGAQQARRLLVADPEPERVTAFAEALRREGFEVDVRDPAGLPTSAQEIHQFGLVVLSDIPAEDVGSSRMELVAQWVADLGGGLLVVGGPNSFGAGGYYRTALERVLPVRVEHSDRLEQPTVALLVSLDRSGSMQAVVEGQTKMALANQGAAMALEVLGPQDFFGFHAVDTRVHEIVPLARNFDRTATAQRVLSVTSAGGGIYLYTALLEAERALSVVDAKTRHLILFADAADTDEKDAGSMSDGTPGTGSSLDLASAMAAKGITITVVAMGLETDPDTAYLKELAARGGGRFYLTNDALSLPQIFTSETMRVAQQSLSEQPVMAVPGVASGMTRGIDWSGAPFLLGFNYVSPKETAEMLLTTENGEPLFAVWRYGLGRAAAFMSDVKDRWASEWLAWPGFGAFWSQVVDGLLPGEGAGPLTARAVVEEERVRIIIDATDLNGAFLNSLQLDVVKLSGGERKEVRATQVAPGRYEAVFAMPEEGTSLFSVQGPGIQPAVVTASRSYPREYLSMETDLVAVEELAKRGRGRVIAQAEEVFVRAGARTQQRWDLAPFLLTLAALLLPLDVFVRRWSWEPRPSARVSRNKRAVAASSKTAVSAHTDPVSTLEVP